MNPLPARTCPPRPGRHWLAKRLLALGLCISGALIAPCGAEPVVLQEPDFTGMFTIRETGPAPVLRDAVRGWTYFSGGNVEGVAFSQWLFRINDAGLPDTQWRLPDDFQITESYLATDGTPIVQAYVKNSPTYEKRWYRLHRESIGLIAPVEISSGTDLPPRDSIDLQQNTGLEPRLLPQRDGTNIAFETAVAPEPVYTVTYTLRKRDRSGRELWSHVLGGGRPHNLGSDPMGNIYVLGEAVTVGGTSGNLIRIRADGSVDSAWTPAIDVASNVSSTMRAVADRIVIADYIGGAPPVNRLTTFDLVSGRKLVERYPQYRLGAIADDGTALSSHANGHWALLDSTRNDDSGDRVSIARVGEYGYARTSVPWRGGYVVGGNFLYWFDGKLHRNLMRVDASFRPDPSWMPIIDDAVAALTVDRDGRLLVASNSASGTQGRIQRFNTDGTFDAGWQPLFKGDVYKLLAASDGMLFVGGAYSAVNDVPRNSLARFRPDGTLDPAWASEPTWPVMLPVRWGQFGRDGIYRILDAGGDGVFFIWEDGFMNGADAGVRRVSRSGVGGDLPLPAGVPSAPGSVSQGGSMMRDPKTGAIYVIASAWELTSGANRGTALVRMVSPSMTVDLAWTTFAGEYGRQFFGFAYQSDSAVYVCRANNGNIELRRFDKTTGREDPNWSSDETFLCDTNWVERRDDGVTLSSSGWYSPFAQFSTTARNTPKTVVEYYSRNARRFFITGRANEIAQLDAMPTNFVRTGMTFAAETALVRTTDNTRAPICRFYAAPEAGGSNSHFYGSIADCTLLKRFPSLRYEGFDFRAGLPTSGACPMTALPTPVYRLFNNASASNNGNHRYVTGQARRSEMLAAGWVDEGVAFCTSDATDSRPLADLVH